MFPPTCYKYSCDKCDNGEPENCPLIRQGIIPGPSEHCRKVLDDDADEHLSAKQYDLDELFGRIPDDLPYGSTALIRVDPKDHDGQDIAPVLIARKAPSPWKSSENAHDGMFADGMMIMWVFDLERVADTERVLYVVPDFVPADQKLRAVPLITIAGLGQGLRGYVRTVAKYEGFRHVELQKRVLETARSDVVLLSTNPSAVFKDFRPEPLSPEDQERCPVRPNLFEGGTVVAKKFTGPYDEKGKKVWRVRKTLRATVTDITTCDRSRRHKYSLQWEGDEQTISEAGVELEVDEGYVENYKLPTP